MSLPWRYIDHPYPLLTSIAYITLFAKLPPIRLQIILLLVATFVGLTTYKPAPGETSAFVDVELWTICNLLLGFVTPIPMLPPLSILIFSVLEVPVVNKIGLSLKVPRVNAPYTILVNPVPSTPIYAKLSLAEFEKPIYDAFVAVVDVSIICLEVVPPTLNSVAFIVPFTSNKYPGVLPIPTLPLLNILILSVAATFVVSGLVENTISPVSLPATLVIIVPISAQLKSDEVGEYPKPIP